jgi:hypothetical protein
MSDELNLAEAETKKLPTEPVEVDPTESRRRRCEPVVQKVLEEMLKHELLLSDKAYVEQMVKYHLSSLFTNLVVGHVNEVFNMLDESLEHTVKVANKTLWGKEDSEVTVADVEKVLKKKK